MDRQLNINLAFTANTEAAKSSLQQLQQQLHQIATQPVSVGEKLTPQLQTASRAAAELQTHLSRATNMKTGALDFGKLTQSIKQSGMTLSEYGAKLQAIGPQGQQAFMSLANSVAMAEVPMRRAGTALSGMLTTLKNTAKWQISSSLLHGFMSSVSDAYNYAQDLNESLNNIRIVTGYNIDQMSKFAAEANKAAKALSTTTTEYTNASLIYYQQGLSDADVKTRTDVTIKMANASRQSAEIVSDQLTAIWNNFDDGTKSLEYYADVITALGAATASSSEEISDGLEKFAAVAETVGLSYEYATAALATVTATTRQSADVVGTAFKTLFARLNDLKLGETLDDGTTLGQYTENLAKIGVNIKDTSGQLKDMDQILNETAAKWDKLGKDQQVALAKGVAGIRQYSQFIALMDNWDFMEENLQTVEASGGTLQKQADIYAESWEAAQDRVRASAEKVYSTLLDDKFFITLTNGFSDLIDGVGNFVDSIGGLGGVLSTFGVILTKVFATQMAEGFRNLVYNIQMSTKAGEYAVQKAKELEMTKFAGMMAKNEASTAAEQQTKQVYEQELTLQKELIANAHNMTEAEQQTYQTLLEQHRIMGQQSIELQKQIELLKESAADKSLEVIGSGMLKGASFEEMAAGVAEVSASATGLREVQAIFQQMGVEGNNTTASMEKIQTILTKIGMSESEINGLAPTFNQLKAGGDDAAEAMQKLQAIIVNINKSKIKSTIVDVAGVRENTKEYERLEKILMAYSEEIGEVRKKELELGQTNDNLKESFTSLQVGLKAAGVNVQDWATHLSTVMSSLMSVGMLISSITGLMDTMNNPDLTGWERTGAIFTSVSMIAMALTGTLKGLGAGVQLVGEVFKKDTLIKTANTLAAYLQEKASKKVTAAKGEETLTTKTSTAATKKDTGAKIENTAAIKLNEGALKTLGVAALKTIGILAILAASALIIKTISDSFHEAEWAAEDAANAASQLRDRYVELQQAYSEFDSVVDKYKEAIKRTEELTDGTDEYKEALLDANNQALELIKKYNLINDYSISGGVITINDAALERAKQQQLIDVGNAQAAANLGAVTASQYSRKSQVNSTARDLNTIGDFQQHAGNIIGTGAAGVGIGVAAGLGTAAMAAKIGGAIGTAITPGIGTAIGAAIGGLAGLITGAVITNENGVENTSETEALDILLKYTKEYGTDIFGAKTVDQFRQMLNKANLKIDDDNVIAAIVQNSQAIKDLTVAELARLESEGVDWREAFNNYNMVNSPEYANLKVGQGYLQYQSELYRNNNIDDIRKEVDAMSKTEVYTKYLQLIEGQKNAAGLVGESVKIADEDWSDASIYDLKDNVWTLRGEKEGLSLDVVKNLVAEAMVLQDASAAMNFDTLSQLIKELKTAGLTLEDNAAIMDQALSNYGGKKLIDFSNFTASEILNIDTSKILDKDFRNAMDKAVNDYKNNMTSIQREIVNSDWYKGLTPEQQDTVWTVDIDEEDTLEEVKRAFEYAQDWLNTNALMAEIEIETKLQSLLKKEQKTKEDWTKIEEYYAELVKKNPNAISWYEFMKMSQSQQIEYIDNLEKTASQYVQETSQGGVSGAKENTTQTWNDYLEEDKKHTEATEEANVEQRVEDYKSLVPEGTFTVTGQDIYGNNMYDYSDYLDGNSFDWNKFIDTISSYEFLDPAIQQVMSVLGTQDYNEVANQIPMLANLLGYNMNNEEEYSNFVNAMEQFFYNKGNNFNPSNYNLLMDGLSQFYDNQIEDIKADTPGAEKKDDAHSDYINAQKNEIDAYKQYQDALDKQEADLVKEGFNLEDIKAIGKALGETNVELKENEYLTNELAKSMMRYERAVKTGIANYDTWKKTLQSGDLIDQIRTINELKTSYGDLLDIDGSLLGQEFLKDTANLELYNSAISGSKEAYSQFQQKAFEAIYTSQIGEMPDDIKNMLSEIDNLDSVKIGDKVVIGESTLATDLENIYIAAVEAAISGGAKVEEAMNIANNLIATKGFDAQVEMVTTEVTTTGQLPTGWTAVEGGGITGPDGTKMPNVKWTAVDGDKYTYTQTFTTPKPISFTKSTENVGGGGRSGSTGTKKSPAENKKYSSLKKKSDVVERYKEWDDALDDVADAMEDVNKQADRLYGASRINALKKQNELLKQQRELLKSKKTDAETNLTSDKNSLLNIASKHGVNFEFDDKGNITNYTTEMTKLFEELHKVEEYWAKASNFSNSETQSDYEKNTVQPIRDKIDEIKDALGIYTDTRELIEDLQNEIDDAFNEWQDNNYDQLHYKLEVQLEVNDAELRMIEYYLNKIADDFYSMAEAAQLIIDKVPMIENSLGYYESFYGNLESAIAADEISQEAYMDGLKETYDSILSNLEALQDLDKEMMHYYEDTLAAGAEELAHYTNRLEHLTGVLDHYHSLITLINGEYDYDSIGTILTGKVATTKNEMDVALQNYQELLARRAEIQANYDNAADENARALHANELKAIDEMIDEHHEIVLSKSQEFIEAQKALMENTIAKAAHDMEKAFTDGMGFDALSNSLSRLSSASEIYLTDTNKIYETQTLINNAQKEIDKTTNTAAKQRLKAYQDEIKALGDKNKLTQIELDIAKAKYDVMLAEIALEEAQNAKATVRLQRDSEGNYGYVYTADSAKVAEAEQNLLDTQNELYNIRLEGANDYGQKIMELNQQLADDLMALEQARVDGQFASEAEYQAAKEKIISEYTELYKGYSESYRIATSEDSRIEEEAWVTAYANIIDSADQWQQHIDTYTQMCEDAYSQYRATVATESEIVNQLLGDVQGSVEGVTTASTTLATKIQNVIIPAIQSEYIEVGKKTAAYAAQRTTILQLAASYETLANKIAASMQANSGMNKEVDLSVDYAAKMYEAWQAGDKAAYNQAKLDREAKIQAQNLTGKVVPTTILDNWIREQNGGPDEHGYFTIDYMKSRGYSFDTGGYTGMWGPEGRLALLHEKELVLNRQDTENFLIATDMLRNIAHMIDMSSLQSQMATLSALGLAPGGTGMLEQMVSIEAHFPNVSDRNEIEEAFNNLINTASQYANRKI